MRFPQVGERMREVPTQALRAMFAGIGQALLVADRMRSRPADSDADQPGTDKGRGSAPWPVAAEHAAARPATAEHRRPAGGRGHPADQTGGHLADQTGGHPADQEASRWRSLETLAEPSSAGTTGPAPLPVANYDDLSLASLRARLRNLDSAQLHALLGYEQAHAARPAVLGMFERRISKLEAGQG
jgi:hypothetical protein